MFRPAKTFGERTEFNVIQENGARRRAEPRSKASIAPGPFCWRRAIIVPADETAGRVIHLPHFRMRVQMARNADAVGVVLEHSTASVLIPER